MKNKKFDIITGLCLVSILLITLIVAYVYKNNKDIESLEMDCEDLQKYHKICEGNWFCKEKLLQRYQECYTDLGQLQTNTILLHYNESPKNLINRVIK